MSKDKLLERARSAQRESKYIDFKAGCDVDSIESWCELVKDIVSMANSGGGVIIFGMNNDGTWSEFDPNTMLTYDAAKVTDKIAKYTTRQFADFEIVEIPRKGKTLAGVVVSETEFPIVFTKAGTYRTKEGREKIAFQPGTVYFRHGAKSEPGNAEDLRDILERYVRKMRRTWLSGIKADSACSV